MLASSNVNSTSDDDLLVPLPPYIFPPEYQPHVFPPRIHHSYIPALETHGTAALLALLDLIESPPVPAMTSSDTFASLLRPFKKRTDSEYTKSVSPKPIRKVEIVGHGLGSAIGLLVAAALHLEISTPTAQEYTLPLPLVEISATLFGLPRVGDQSFANWVDSMVLSSLHKVRISRVTSYADTIPHLPERHLELRHPSLGEIWVGADPRIAYACRSAVEHDESDLCSASIPLPKTSLLDHEGPFGGIWIGSRSCRWSELDLTEL